MYSETFDFNIETSSIVRPERANFSMNRPLDGQCFINGIEFLLSPEFAKKGLIYVSVNGIKKYETSLSGNLKNYYKFPLSLGVLLNSGGKIEISAWNGTDSNPIMLSGNIQISSELKPLSTEASSLNKDVLNNAVSEVIELFPFAVYYNETLTEIIDMEGFKKLLITMSASTIPNISNPINSAGKTGNVTWGDITCPNLDTGGQLALETNTDFEQTTIVDLNNSSTKNIQFTINGSDSTSDFLCPLSASLRAHTCSGQSLLRNVKASYSILIDVLESDDVNFATYTTLYSGKTKAQLQALIPITTTKRYLKFIQHVTNLTGMSASTEQVLGGGGGDTIVAGGNFNYTIDGMSFTTFSNLLTVGGLASLSFEILGSGNQWIEFISATEIGTVTSGNTIIKQIGDVVSRNTTDKVGFTLPSTQTNFRAKLLITNGIETGVSIIKVT